MIQRATIKRARELRSDQPNAERLFWSRVRNRQLGNWKFRRQAPIGPYIIDFYVDEVKAIIELDGAQHGRGNHPVRDENRGKWLKKKVFRHAILE
ncbi:MAG: DUF559 domain-containing protein [Alphaproteobacteria bacterium]|nr:DUF559 domain-containing protein [Alphaproteobacteria bacterium]